MIRLALAFICFAPVAWAEVLVAARTIPAQTILRSEDLVFRDIVTPGALSDPAEIVGKEARVALFAGRPIRPADLGAPAVVERNQVISLIYEGAGLYIKTDGRALDRAGPGDIIRVMNLASRSTVTAVIDDSGVAYVTR